MKNAGCIIGKMPLFDIAKGKTFANPQYWDEEPRFSPARILLNAEINAITKRSDKLRVEIAKILAEIEGGNKR